LCYHNPRPEVFEAHLRVLRRLYHPIPLRRYLDWRRRPEAGLPAKPLVLTLDDGHRNNYLLRDVLARHRVTPTVFLCSGIVGTRRRYWWTAASAGDREALKRVPDGERRRRLAHAGYCETAESEERQALTADEVEALKTVVDFQSHTRFHPILPQCADERAREEIAASKTELERRFGLSIYALAYPNGDYSLRDAELARQAGYECALTLDGGSNARTTPAFGLRRIPISDSAGRHELVVKASGLWSAWERRAAGPQPQYRSAAIAGEGAHVGADLGAR
jgi:poly-beta-1,6-N-acetyl-D-glucosamine N-deacetylase